MEPSQSVFSPSSAPAQPKLTFDELSNPDKVRAILAHCVHPVTRELALQYAGVPAFLSPDESAEIMAVFTSADIDQTEGKDGIHYKMKEQAAQAFNARVDEGSVKLRFADILFDK